MQKQLITDLGYISTNDMQVTRIEMVRFMICRKECNKFGSIKRQLTHSSKATRQDRYGKLIAFLCTFLIGLLVASILYLVASRGLATFFKNHVSVWDFLTKQNWNPGQVDKNGAALVGALPMIVGSFL